MRVEITHIVIAAVILTIIILVIYRCELKCSYSENFGQDATTRTQVGWIAGPKGMYGYDPIDHFADQIGEMRREERERLRRGLYMMTDYPNLESSPTKDIGPVERYRPSQEEKPCGSCMTTEEFENM